MATTTVEKIDYSMMLNNGSSTTGAIRTLKLPLANGSLKMAIPTSGNNDTAALAIMAAIEQILTRSVYEAVKSTTEQIEG